MEVWKDDPDVLSWGPGTIIGIFKPGRGLLKGEGLSGISHPSDKEFQQTMERAKELSKDGISFLVMKRNNNGEKRTRQIPFAEFNDGELVAYCRPPWLVGKRLP
jgi:hypothetical protein